MVGKQASGHLVNAYPLSRGLLQRSLGLAQDDVPLYGRYRRYR